MNAQPIATKKLIPAFSSCSLALRILWVIRAVGRFFGSKDHGPLCGRRVQYLLLPLLLCGLGAAIPSYADVLQLQQNPVVTGTQVSYEVKVSNVPANGSVAIQVLNNGVDVSQDFTPASLACSDGIAYCDGSGSYSMYWTPPAGVNNLQFIETVYDAVGGNLPPITEFATTAVGTEGQPQLQAYPDTYTFTKVGDVITYSYQVTNPGSLPLSSVVVTDSRLGTISGCGSVPGNGSVTCTKTYTVTQADLDAGSITNDVTVTAPSYAGGQLTASAQITVDGGVMKLQISATPAVFSKVGDVITFDYTVTNSGTLPLDGVAVSDAKLGTISGCGTTLAAGASTSCSKTYTITQVDLDAGSLTSSGDVVASTAVPGGDIAPVQVTASAKALVLSGVASGLTPGSDLTLLPNLTPNQVAVAGAITNLCATTTDTTVLTQCTNLYSLTTTQIQNALQQMVPDQLAAQGTNAVETAFTQMSNISQRLLALRSHTGNTMLALKGLMLAVNGQSIPLGMLADAAAAGNSSIANSGRLGGFVKGRIQLGSRDTTTNVTGYDFSTKGLTAGIDYRLNDQVVLGGALGYASTSNDYNSSRGDMSSDGTTLSLYGSYYAPQDMYLDWIASYGSNNYDSTRNLVYSGVNTQTQGSTDGSQLGLSVSMGKDINRGAWLFTPYVRAEYVEAKINGYNESGGSGLALSYDNQTVRSFISAAAARLSKTISARSGVYTPSAHLEWEHQYRNDQRMITAHFVGDPATPFQVSTDSPDRNYFNLGASLAAAWPGGRSGFISCETVLGQSHISNYTFDIGVRQEF